MPERILELILKADSNPWLTAILVFLGSSVAGLATLLREGKPIDGRNVASATLNSGLFGTIIFLVAWQYYRENLPGLVGISLLAGIGAASLISFAITLMKRRMAALAGVDACSLEKPRE